MERRVEQLLFSSWNLQMALSRGRPSPWLVPFPPQSTCPKEPHARPCSAAKGGRAHGTT